MLSRPQLSPGGQSSRWSLGPENGPLGERARAACPLLCVGRDWSSHLWGTLTLSFSFECCSAPYTLCAPPGPSHSFSIRSGSGSQETLSHHPRSAMGGGQGATPPSCGWAACVLCCFRPAPGQVQLHREWTVCRCHQMWDRIGVTARPVGYWFCKLHLPLACVAHEAHGSA